MNKVVKVLDNLMGRDRSEAAVGWIKRNPKEKYIYITNSLEHSVGYLRENLSGVEFVTANSNRGGEDLLSLLKRGSNVITSGNSLLSLSGIDFEFLLKHKYTLIMEGEIEVVKPFRGMSSKDDIGILEEAGSVTIDYNNLGKVTWVRDYEFGSYDEIKSLAKAGVLHATPKSSNKNIYVSVVPTDLLLYCKEVVILTYLFEGGILHKLLQLRGFSFEDVCLYDEKPLKEFVADRVRLHEVDRSSLPEGCTLSYSYLTKLQRKVDAKGIHNTILKCYRKSLSGRRDSLTETMVTLPKINAKGLGNKKKDDKLVLLGGKISPKTWVACNSKNYSKYTNKTRLIHSFNRFPSTEVESFIGFWSKEFGGGGFNRNLFALKELLDWIYLSALSVGAEVDLFIVSERMERIFRNWLEE